MRDDPIADGHDLARDSDVVLPSDGTWARSLDGAFPSLAGSEHREIADLVRLGVLDDWSGEGGDITMDDIRQPEQAFVIRHVDKRTKGKRGLKGAGHPDTPKTAVAVDIDLDEWDLASVRSDPGALSDVFGVEGDPDFGAWELLEEYHMCDYEDGSA